MGSLLIDRIRISGFRGIKDLELTLNQTTVLTGMNNTGKTSIIKAIQLALGNKSFLTLDDFHISGNKRVNKIIVDIRFVQTKDDGSLSNLFEDKWERVFKEDKIKIDSNFSYVPIRTIVKYNQITNKFDFEQQILQIWLPPEQEHWININGVKRPIFLSEEVPFFYIDAKRDIVEDMKLKSSYLGRLLSNLNYSEEDINELENLISKINENAVEKSNVLRIIQQSLEELNTAIDKNGGIDITPFAKRIRDLNKNMSIHYGENDNSFTMDFHGMGTRSWSSLLTLKAFINYSRELSEKEDFPFFPIIAIEEPESHLHPNAQKKSYTQINSICGQKIISTHSPYIAAASKLDEIRVLTKKNNNIEQGILDVKSLSPEDIRKLNQKVISLRGEIFFSKILVFFEGETEEQALPLFAENYWGLPAYEIGINFIGVGGAGQYLPFLRFAQAFNIPWFIFSDGEKRPLSSVTKAIKELKNKKKDMDLSKENNVIILDDELDFEGYILRNGYKQEIENVIKQIHSDENYIETWIEKKDGTLASSVKTDEICKTCNQNIYKQNIRDYRNNDGYLKALDDIIGKDKTEFAPMIAQEIINSGKEMPPKILLLFSKINKTLGL